MNTRTHTTSSSSPKAPIMKASRYIIKSNIEHLPGNVEPLNQEELYKQTYDSYLMNTLEQRQLYSDQLAKLNKSRGIDQQAAFPINRNITTSVGRLSGGASSGTGYVGPRG